MSGTIDFYLDFISPFSYLAYQRLPAIAQRHGCTLALHVINLAEAKKLAGNTGPTTREQPLKRRYSQFDKDRWAARYGVPIVNPTSYGPDRLNKGFFFAADRNAAAPYVAAAFHAVWGLGGDMAGEAILRDLAGKFGWKADEFLGFVEGAPADARYREATAAAHKRGVFGVPTMMVGEEIWWGNDRLEFLEDHLRDVAGGKK